MEFKSKVDRTRLPKHIAIIMDGNGRWAQKRGEDRILGHQNGVVSVREVVEGAAEIGVQYVTLYAFSTENWNRPKYEVDALMQLLVHTLSSEIGNLNKNQIRLKAIGNLQSLPESCYAQLQDCIQATAQNTRMTLVLALSYSSRWEIIEATKQIAIRVKSGDLDPTKIDENTIEAHLCTATIPDPELMIRTSGEHRISNFLMWQLSYAEFYFTEKLWPDFRKEDLYEAIVDYQGRERRFGKTSQQVTG